MTEKQPAPPRALATGKPQSREALARVPLRSLPHPGLLDRPLESLPGVGPATGRVAAKLGLATLADLLEHLPFDHRDYERRRKVSELAIGEEATVAVSVRSCHVRPTRRRSLRLLECQVADESGPLKAVWFNQEYLLDQLTEGRRMLLRGRLERNRGGPTFKVLEHELAEVDGNGSGSGRHTTGLVPVYPATEGLSTRRIRDLAWRVRGLERNALETLPARLRAGERLPCRADSLAAAHFPHSPGQVPIARRRLALEELFVFQLALISRRRTRQVARAAPLLGDRGPLVQAWLDSLEFQLTGDQRKALEAIDGDLTSGGPMQRLLAGEVGSGKTVVALYAMLRAAEAGMQAALMAPTETLAEQHFGTMERLISPELFAGAEDTSRFSLGRESREEEFRSSLSRDERELPGLERGPIGLITGSTPARRRRELIERLRTGELRLLVGTHALIEEGVEFPSLALVVVDEQHRFGVRQRGALDGKGQGELAPHVLHLTATPIPRTLALTLYGDLHATTLHELPAGRRPVKTWVVPEEKRAGAYEFIRERLREGRQCFVVCPLVEESEQLQARAATREGERLARGEFRDFSLDVMHGQMPSQRKREVMARFASGAVEVLVATSVIEVGIDVANASVMVIEEADRYGISQLHQLRGRVGRGEHESYCLLFSGARSELASRRLEAVAGERDGFKLAEIDLTLRGEGDLLGTKQSGLPDFRVARLPEDAELLDRARRLALELLRSDPDLSDPEHAILHEAIVRRFGAPDIEPVAA
jgi:ATP-dependent DNA helicase RecG